MKVKFGCSISDQGNKIPDKVQVKKGESEQTDASKIRARVLEGMGEEELCRPENNVDYKKLPNGDKEVKRGSKVQAVKTLCQ